MSKKTECTECGQMVANFPAHRILTKTAGKPCSGKPKPIENKDEIIREAIRFCNNTSYEGGDCISSFSWWLDEDAFLNDFEGFKYTYTFIHGIADDFMKENPEYKCENAECGFCK